MTRALLWLLTSDGTSEVTLLLCALFRRFFTCSRHLMVFLLLSLLQGRMENLRDRLKVMVQVFRRECHRVLHSERTTIHGADDMVIMLQLAIAEVNKEVTTPWSYSCSQSGPNLQAYIEQKLGIHPGHTDTIQSRSHTWVQFRVSSLP